MNLSHFTDEPLRCVRSTAQLKDPMYRGVLDKPIGLWVSVDGEHDWQDYCRGFPGRRGKLRYSVTLASNAKILLLDTLSRIAEFVQQYGVEASYGIPSMGPAICWESVAQKHEGIIISPYQHSLRGPLLFNDWYLTWDCASGCIWDRRAIDNWKRIEEDER